MIPRSIRSTVLFVVVLALVIAAIGGLAPRAAVAQEATPAAAPATLPAAPDPALCTTEPRPSAEYEALLGTPVASEPEPVVIAGGVPADQATIEAITATMIEAAACTNAHGFRGLGSFYTEAGFLEDNVGLDQEFLDFLETNIFAEEDNRYAIHAISAVQVLADGRVATIVQFGLDGGVVDLLIFAEADGRYLIDLWVDEPFDITFSMPDAEEATPAA